MSIVNPVRFGRKQPKQKNMGYVHDLPLKLELDDHEKLDFLLSFLCSRESSKLILAQPEVITKNQKRLRYSGCSILSRLFEARNNEGSIYMNLCRAKMTMKLVIE